MSCRPLLKLIVGLFFFFLFHRKKLATYTKKYNKEDLKNISHTTSASSKPLVLQVKKQSIFIVTVRTLRTTACMFTRQ